MFGVFGYIIIEGYDFLDALYMTIITVATVGFDEVHDLSPNGKIFTIFLIISSMGTFAYSLSVITVHFVEGELSNFILGYKSKFQRKKMKNHIIVCGYGRNGRQAVKELRAHKKAFLIIEEKKESFLDEPDKTVFVEGDATNDEILILAGVENARAIITTFPNDADNLYVVLTARSLNPNLLIISRASNDSSEKKLKVAGANSVVMPDKVGGSHMATLVLKPDVVSFLDLISFQGNSQANLEEIMCSNLPESFRNKTIDEIGIRSNSGVNIVGYKTPEGEFIINPSAGTKLIKDSKLFVLGTSQQILKMKEIIKSGGPAL
ncbi:MAG: potassium channel protein [Bacteroidetes bacterium]|nr:potassium channel protein [Bacteroidota bacterium]